MLSSFAAFHTFSAALGCAGLAEMATVLGESTEQALVVFVSAGEQHKGGWK